MALALNIALLIARYLLSLSTCLLLTLQALIFIRKGLTHEDTLEYDCGDIRKKTIEIDGQITNISSLSNLRQGQMTWYLPDTG